MKWNFRLDRSQRNEFGQIYRYDFATRRSVRLTPGDRSQNGGIRWSHAGDRIAYGSTRRNGADRDLYVILLSNRVHPTRANQKIQVVRRQFADAVIDAFDRATK